MSGMIVNRYNYQYDTRSYLSSTDFPNTTTLYGWRAPTSDAASWTNVYGGIDLTRTGALTTAADELGNTKACVFGGANDNLYSSDAAFNFTGTFSIGFWVYRTSWAATFGATAQYIIGNFSADNKGWNFFGASNGTRMTFQTFTGGASSTTLNIDGSSLSAGWHHFSIIRSNGSYTAIYIDGLILAKTATTGAITASNKLIVFDGPNSDRKFTGRVQDIWIHKDTAWTSEEVKKIYARSSRRYFTTDASGYIVEPMPLEGVWFKFTTTATGFSSVAQNYLSYNVRGKQVVLNCYVQGTSNANTFTIQLPIINGTLNGTINVIVRIMDNGTSAVGHIDWTDSTSTCTIYPSITGAANSWTTSGIKVVDFRGLTYNID